jgi:hypothetical protein
MKFLIQRNLSSSTCQNKVCDAVKQYPHQFVDIVPFSHEIVHDELLNGTDYIPYGSTLFTSIAYEKKWKGLYFDIENFSMKKAIAKRSDMLNQDSQILTVKQAIEHLRQLPVNENVFVRPDLDLKHFVGQVITASECADWFADAMSLPLDSGSYAMDPDMLVCIAIPKLIQAEWRYFIVNNEVVSGSKYRVNGQLHQRREKDSALICEAQQLANQWKPHVNCVMDLAVVNDETKVVEFNCINSSGFYECDVDMIFKKLAKYIQDISI